MGRIIKILSTFIILITSCRETTDDISGSESITGKVYLFNPYDSSFPTPQSGQRVLLQRSTDSTSSTYMFSAVSDLLAEFSFSYLYSDRQYKVYAETNQNTPWDNAVLFSALAEATPGRNLELTMQPDSSRQNALCIFSLDSVTIGSPGIIPNDSIYIYTSSVLAISDSSEISGNGASYKFVSNVRGTVFKVNLPFDRPLFVNAACTYSGKRYKSKFSTVQLSQRGFDTLKLVLQN